MQTVPFALSDDEYAALEASNPASKKNADIGARAVEVIRLYAKRLYWNERRAGRRRGVDLAFMDTQGQLIEMEVKGTDDTGVHWEKLGVSGKPCYSNLTNGMPLYRVTAVFDKNPTIFILKYGEDFTMVPEPRWKIKQKT